MMMFREVTQRHKAVGEDKEKAKGSSPRYNLRSWLGQQRHQSASPLLEVGDPRTWKHQQRRQHSLPVYDSDSEVEDLMDLLSSGELGIDPQKVEALSRRTSLAIAPSEKPPGPRMPAPGDSEALTHFLRTPVRRQMEAALAVTTLFEGGLTKLDFEQNR